MVEGTEARFSEWLPGLSPRVLPKGEKLITPKERQTIFAAVYVPSFELATTRLPVI